MIDCDHYHYQSYEGLAVCRAAEICEANAPWFGGYKAPYEACTAIMAKWAKQKEADAEVLRQRELQVIERAIEGKK